jgi:hypothetical protein
MDIRIEVEYCFGKGDEADYKCWFASPGKRFPGSYVMVQGLDFGDNDWLVLERGVPAGTPLGEGSMGMILTDTYRCCGRDYFCGEDFGLLAFVSRQGHVYPLLRASFGGEILLSEMWPVVVSAGASCCQAEDHLDKEEDVLVVLGEQAIINDEGEVVTEEEMLNLQLLADEADAEEEFDPLGDIR